MAKLVLFKNQKKTLVLELDTNEEYFAGRSQENDLVLDEPTFSRRHLRIFYEDSFWKVELLSQYSVVLHNGVETQNFTLEDGDNFSIYPFRLEFHSENKSKENVSHHNQDPASKEQKSLEEQNSFEEQNLDQNQVLDKSESASPNPSFSSPADELDNPTGAISSPQFDDEKTYVPQNLTQNFGVPYLIIRSEETSPPQTLRLEGDFWIIGRDEGADITIHDEKASRDHCEIYKKGNDYFVQDKESSNGTRINGIFIEPLMETLIRSGDTIQIGRHLLTFEIRDPNFMEKVSRLPVEFHSKPVPFEQPTHNIIRLDPSISSYSTPPSSSNSISSNKKQPFYIALAIIVLAVAYILNDSSTEDSQKADLSSKSTEVLADQPSDELSADQREFVERSYQLAKTLYTQGQYELVLSEVQKIHDIIPEYKDSKELLQYSKNAIDTLLEQKEMDKKEEELRRQAQKVDKIIEDCRTQYQSHQSTSQLNECLSPAIELDPENKKIANLQSTADQNDVNAEVAREKRVALQGRITSRKQLFSKAETLKNSGKILEAIVAYQRHIASTLPDPENLEAKSKEEVSNLQKKIKSDISSFKSSAQSMYDGKDYKSAIKTLEKAIKLDPEDEEVKGLHAKYSKELFGIVKTLYGDSVLEENLGNIESAKDKWRKITTLDVEYGDYYKKAKSKLKKYGL